MRRDEDIDEIKDHALQLLPEPEHLVTDQPPAEVMLLRIEAVIAQMKTELDPFQLAELFPVPSQGHSDGYGTCDNPFVVDAPPSSQAPVTDSITSTSTATVFTINATFPTVSFSFFVLTSTMAASASTAPILSPIFPTSSSIGTAPASTLPSKPCPAPSVQVPDVFQRSESQARLLVPPSYAEKYAGNRDEGRKRLTPDPGPFAILPGGEIEERLRSVEKLGLLAMDGAPFQTTVPVLVDGTAPQNRNTALNRDKIVDVGILADNVPSFVPELQ